MASAMLTTTPRASSTRWRSRQLDRISPPMARQNRKMPGSIAISGGEGSAARAPEWLAPQSQDSAGAVRKPCNGGENRAIWLSRRRLSGCCCTTVR